MQPETTTAAKPVSCVEWLRSFASSRPRDRFPAGLPQELPAKLHQLYDRIDSMTPGSRLSGTGAGLAPQDFRESRTALLNKVGETLYVLGCFSSSPELCDFWVKGQVQRFLDAFDHLRELSIQPSSV